MAIGSGLSSQIGYAAETTYGTVVTVTRFLDLISADINPDIDAVEAFASSRGRMIRTGRRKVFEKGPKGSVSHPVMTKGMGLLLKHMLGTSASAQQGGTSEYHHTFTVDLTSGKQGLMLTTQLGKPDTADTSTIHPFTFGGGKIVGWELKCDLDGMLELMLDMDFKNVVTSTALASASYASGDDFFIFEEGAVTLNSVSQFVRSFSLKGEEGMDVDRRALGNTKRQPIAAAEQVLTGTLDVEFESLTAHAAFVAGTELTNLIVTFDTGTAIPTGVANFRMVITVPLLQITAASVPIGGPEILRQTYDFKVLNNGAASPVTILYATNDTAI